MFSRAAAGKWNVMGRMMAVLCLILVLFPSIASAQLPYSTWYLDPMTFRINPIQPIYVPSKLIDGNRMDIPLNSPSDLYIAGNDHVYIADTGNDRIVELNANGEYVRSIGDKEGPGQLSRPEGVFVAADGTVYVANTAGETVVKFGADGRFQKAFPKPESTVLGKDYFYQPTKLVVDSRGVMYVVVKDSFQGLLRMNPEGKFTGFFGANKTKLDWMDRLNRAVLSKEQVAKLTAKRPNAIENITLGPDGFLYTTSSGREYDGQIKKLNAGGVDAFKNKTFREYSLVDMAVDANGFLYGMDRGDRNEIAVYDPTGQPMFYFSGGDKNARQLGITSFASSIAVNGRNELWVADNRSGLIHVFSRTSFGDTYLTAAHMYFEGDYEESRKHWEEVIRQNGMVDLPFDGLGKIALHDKDYEAALQYFEQSHDAQGYSDAFWNIRYEWLQRNFAIAFLCVAAAVAALVYGWRKGKAFVPSRTWPTLLERYGTELRDALYLMAHPYNGFYRLKDRRISWLVIVLILALAVLVHIWSIFGSGFIAYPFDLGTYNVKLSLGKLILPWVTWVIANYLVSSVKGGEGRFREVLQASTYAVVPYIVFMIPIVLLTNVLVIEEWVVIDLLRQIMWIWIVVLLLVMTQVIHNFDFVEAMKNAGITVFTIGVMWVFVVIMSALGVNLYDFLEQIYREVTFHG